MNTIVKKVSAAAIFCMLFAPAAFASTEYQDVVRDERGNVVVSTFGDCVRTKWVVNANTCGQLRVANEERTVYFDFNSARLTKEAKTKLDNLLKTIRASKQVKNIDIVGYADRIGGQSSYNQKLSMRRARAVKAYLASKGYRDTRNVEVRGLGASDSITACSADLPRAELIQCLRADRRVEIELNLAQ